MTDTKHTVRTYGNFIDGEWVQASDEQTYETYDPGDADRVVSRFPLATAEDVDRAVRAAHRAFGDWRAVPAPERMEYVHALVEIWRRRRDELAEAVTLEMGKPLVESRNEVDRGIGEMRFTAGEALRIGGETLPSVRRNHSAYTVREPLGVVAAITPWNFPVLSPLRKVIPALVSGCTAVLKPASATPLPAAIIIEMLQEAGIPRGVVNFVTGRGGEAGDALVNHDLVSGITFTGSTDVGLELSVKAARNNVRVQVEMGGKNACVVAGCDDLENAAAQIVPAAFTTSGQRCTSISRVVVLREHQRELETALEKEVAKLRIGHGLDESTTMGPLVNKGQRERSASYIRHARTNGARVLTGGEELADGGYYFEPTILTDVKPGNPEALNEIFGPVLSVIPVDTFEEAIGVSNEVEYGLTASIFTDDMEMAQAFVDASQTGMVHVNNGTVSEGHMPFGGVKQSGRGAYSIGATNKEFFTNLKVVYHQHIELEGRNMARRLGEAGRA